ncbi:MULTISPECIES: PucR family transcriptional regulator [Microbacterium]|uniref:PucR family transcriptional regulator n=1 Tax=Microbacterium TaxID=33882 RepID=UPI00217DE4D9|nr:MULTISPECIES: PucR family transcriptional regulator [Microbacterium]UWF77153.1 PucR family transcriptional regulator [Microbacterium neungamense]WCM55309.1 PucR family transcriptional regulator [Microbacterium sp. EF45047]
MEQPTLRSLLRRRDLGLRLVADESALAEAALDHPLRWVHSSDLADPTPFLAEDLVLLTTGTQFADDDPAGVDAYVARLAGHGVLGLGFGTEVHRSGIPEELAAACAARGMPLFEVPYGTPFIAIARAHAEAIAAQAYARRTWALETQRALAIAALRPRGLDATLTELSRRLDAWVGMFDATGALVHEHPSLAAEAAPELSARVAELLARGGQASQSLVAGDAVFSLFTLGRGGHLRGVIAIAVGTLDPEARAVVTSVIAMAGLALEQNEQLERARRRLRSQVLASLLLDDPSLARQVLGSVPHAPVVVAVAEPDAPVPAILEWWDRRRTDDGVAVFAAESEDGLTMCVNADDEPLLAELAERFGVRLGVSEPEGYAAFSRAHAQALAALRRRRPGLSRYADAATSFLLTALGSDEARLAAEARLAPLRRHDEAAGTDLEGALRAWLEHDARLEPAAAALGVHRHTLRSWIAQASGILSADLSGFPARAELWAALQTAGTRGATR